MSHALTAEPVSPIKHLLSPDSSLSDAPPPPTKKRRTSQSDSSLSDAEDEEEEEEDRPLAARIPLSSSSAKKVPANGSRTVGHRAGKKTGMKGVSHTTVPSEQPHSAAEGSAMIGRTNGAAAHDTRTVKIEDKLDERKLSRLATGVTVDTGIAAPTPVRRSSFFAVPQTHDSPDGF